MSDDVFGKHCQVLADPLLYNYAGKCILLVWQAELTDESHHSDNVE